MKRSNYTKWKEKTYDYLKKRKIRIYKKSVDKLRIKVYRAMAGLNKRKYNVYIWSFNDVSTIVLAAIGQPCTYCTQILTWNSWSLDHKKPVARHGTNSKQNIQVVCKGCNRRKGSFSNKFFRKLLAFLELHLKYKKELLARLGFGGSYHSRRN